MKLDKLFILRLFLLMSITLKVSHVVYQNVSLITDSTHISYVLELEESENEEKKELDESEKIQEKVNSFSVTTFNSSSLQTTFFKLNYKIFHLEFTTPPPKIG